MIKKGLAFFYTIVILLFYQTINTGQCPFHFAKTKTLQTNKLQRPSKIKSNNILFGNYPELRKGIMPFLSSVQKNYNYTVMQFNFPFSGILFSPYNVVFCPQLAKQILYDQNQIFIKGKAIDPFRKLFAPEGITFMENNAHWKALHAVLEQGPFNPRNFPERYGKIFKNHFDEFITRLKQKYHHKPCDLYEEITYFTMAVIAESFFSYHMSKGELEAIVPAFKFILDYIQSRELEIIPTPSWIPTKKNRLFAQSITLLNNFYKTLIVHDPKTITTHAGNFKTIISLLQEYKHPNTKQKLSSKKIVSHIGTLFFAGHDTTANLITMALYQLQQQKNITNTIAQEIQNTYDKQTHSYIPMGTLPTLDLFLKEILRLYPSVPIITRQATQDVVIGKYQLYKNDIIIIPIAHINRHPDYFTNPLTFNPYRFLQNNYDYNPNSLASFIPFGIGSRRCLGQWFALSEARSFIVQLLTSNIQLYTSTGNKELVDLKMTSTGLPNQTIYCVARNKPALSVNFSNVENAKTDKSSGNLREMCMQITDKRFENNAQTVVTLRLEPTNTSTIPNFQPGDYLTLYIQENNEIISSRHYTISSSPMQKKWIEITTKYETDGIGSEYIHKKLSKNDIVNVRIPLHDTYTLPKNTNTPLVLISGGIGITPMISIVRYLIATKWNGDIYIIHASKNRHGLPFKNELAQWNSRYPNIHVSLFLTKEKKLSTWFGPKRRFCIDDVNRIIGKKITQSKVIICGTHDMTTSITYDLLQLSDVDENQIYTLSFGTFSNINARNNITHEEVAQHNKNTDAWIVIDNKVFDITRYINQHPGLDIIRDYIGADATHAFHSIAHSANAQRDMAEHPDITFVGFIKKTNPSLC